MSLEPVESAIQTARLAQLGESGEPVPEGVSGSPDSRCKAATARIDWMAKLLSAGARDP